jgi:predicted MFS family arabinose efflux permease
MTVATACSAAEFPSPQSADAPWMPVIGVGIAAFVMVTTEFMPVGLLPAIAASLHQTEGRTGLMVTLPGILAAISAPMTIALAGKVDRRRVLAGLRSLLELSNLIVLLSQSLEMMLVGRRRQA